MGEISQIFKRGQSAFQDFVGQIQRSRTSDISIRRALKKYEVKSLKITAMTALRARKMYKAIIQKYHSVPVPDKSWLENERRLFVWCTVCYLYVRSLEVSSLEPEDFLFLNSMFPQKQLDLVKFQVYSLVKKNNRNCDWENQEDALLKLLVQQKNTRSIEWSSISKQFFTQSNEKYFRSAKQCRQRWLNQLDPSKMKGKWEPEQDKILLRQVLEKGKKWSKIVSSLNDKKNEHMIKNRYKSLIHKQEKNTTSKGLKENELIRIILKEYEEGHHSPQTNNLEEPNSMGDRSQRPLRNHTKNECVKQEESQVKVPAHQFSSNWPILVEPNNRKAAQKEKEGAEEGEGKQEKQVDLCGCRAGKQFVNSLFFNISTPVAEDPNRLHPIMMEARSPAGSLFLSPFPGCWTPTLFLVDDTQQSSPQNIFGGFSSTVKSAVHKFIVDEGEKKS